MQEKVRKYIKEYYKDIVLTTTDLKTIYNKKLTIKEKVVNLADLLNFCTPYLPEDCKITERLYHVLNDLYEIPKCHICNTNFLKFNMFNKGYNNTCSLKCSKNNEEYKEKVKNTSLIRYGVENYSQTEEFKDKYKKVMTTNYGVEHYSHTKEFKDKCKTTSLSKYKTIHYSKTIEYKERCKQTNLNKYDVENIFKLEEFKHKFKEKQFNSLLSNTERLNNCTPLFDLEEFKNNKISDNYKWKWSCNICNTIFYDGLDNGASPVCPKCYKIHGSNLQKEIYEFVYNYTDNIGINDRSAGFEIDLYLKDYNLGIEVNGNYWHSDLHGKDKYYHLNKLTELDKLGITLIHIFEDDWLYKKDIVKNIILNKLGLITNNISNLVIYQIKNDYAGEFLNNNCVNGNIDIKDNINILHYGLCDLNNIYYLISVQDNKIVRYCSKLGCKIANNDISKLISHICKENNLDTLIVYCDLRYDSGELFKELDFNYLKFKHPTYDYVNKKNYKKRIDKENLIFENYDDKLSIWYNAMNNGYDRIWNCGYIIYEYNL